MSMNSADIRICFVGDSIVNGTHDMQCLGWPGRVCSSALRSGHQVTHYNLGVRRNTSRDIGARWLGECQNRLPKECDCRVVFSFGANDTVIEAGQQRVNTDDSLYYASQIMEEAKERYSCLWVGPAPLADDEHNARLLLLCEAFQGLSQQIGIGYLPVLKPLMQSPLWMDEVAVGDGAHPPDQGYGELAKLVQSWPAWWFNS